MDATQLGRWRPFCSASPIWTPYAQSHGVQFCCSSQSGRLSHSHIASIPAALPDLDASHTVTWRPFRTTSTIWTPYAQSHGVHVCCSSRFGRLVGQHVASVPAAFPNLDAIRAITRRPCLLLFSSWTPLNSDAGVRSAQLLQSGRLGSQHVASVPAALRNLDATCQIAWRPFLLLFPIWTPYAQSHGVQFCCSSQVGRHSTRTLASILLSFPDLDAIRTITWRPILLLFSSWTPLTQSHGVRSTQLPRFGRHPLNHMASIPHIFSNLDASSVNMWRPIYALIAIWTPFNIWTPCYTRIHPPISPEFRKMKQATAWLSIILESQAVAFISLMWKVYSPKGINLLRILFGYCLSWNLMLELLFAGFSLYQFNYFYYWDYQD